METRKLRPSPFVNDPFAMVWEAFKTLYPDKECECSWNPLLEDEEENGEPIYGYTHFGDDGTVLVCVGTGLPINHSVEIFAHELAHVAVGKDHEHDEAWEQAFEAIYQEYNRMIERESR